MKFKEIFDKAVLTEEHVRKGLKIFYEIDLDLIKPKVPEQSAVPQQPAATPETTQPVQSVQNPEQQPVNSEPMSAETPEQSQQEISQNTPEQSVEEPENTEQDSTQNFSASSFKASVVTEDEVSETTEERIVRKFEGVASLSESEKDNIQSFEDVVDVLSRTKKNGTEILDEFSTEIINLCIQQNFQEIKTKVDKKSKIFVEVYYGYKKDDSCGLRFSKRPNSDMLTSTMLIDNEIISAKFNIEKLNQQVAEYRNYDANK